MTADCVAMADDELPPEPQRCHCGTSLDEVEPMGNTGEHAVCTGCGAAYDRRWVPRNEAPPDTPAAEIASAAGEIPEKPLVFPSTDGGSDDIEALVAANDMYRRPTPVGEKNDGLVPVGRLAEFVSSGAAVYRFPVPTAVPPSGWTQARPVDQADYSQKFASEFPLVAEVLPIPNVVVAGGSAAYPLGGVRGEDGRPDDVDLFIYGIDPADTGALWEKLREIVSAVTRAAKILGSEGGGFSGCIQTLCPGVCTITDHEYSRRHRYNRRSRHPGPGVKIQVILRAYPSVSSILHAFDVPSCAVAFDGKRTRMTLLGAYAHAFRVNVVVPKYRSTTYESRLAKYARRGFAVACPNLDLQKCAGPGDGISPLGDAEGEISDKVGYISPLGGVSDRVEYISPLGGVSDRVEYISPLGGVSDRVEYISIHLPHITFRLAQVKGNRISLAAPPEPTKKQPDSDYNPAIEVSWFNYLSNRYAAENVSLVRNMKELVGSDVPDSVGCTVRLVEHVDIRPPTEGYAPQYSTESDDVLFDQSIPTESDDSTTFDWRQTSRTHRKEAPTGVPRFSITEIWGSRRQEVRDSDPDLEGLVNTLAKFEGRSPSLADIVPREKAEKYLAKTARGAVNSRGQINAGDLRYIYGMTPAQIAKFAGCASAAMTAAARARDPESCRLDATAALAPFRERILAAYDRAATADICWWVIRDPGRQYTASLDPRCETPQEWYGKAYTASPPYGDKILAESLIGGLGPGAGKGRVFDGLCSICFDSVRAGDANTITLRCGHVYHWAVTADCAGFAAWIEGENTTCPVCQREIAAEDDDGGPAPGRGSIGPAPGRRLSGPAAGRRLAFEVDWDDAPDAGGAA